MVINDELSGHAPGHVRPKSISIIASTRSIRILNRFLIENIASSLHVAGALPTFGLRREFLWANLQEDIGEGTGQAVENHAR